MIMPSTIPNTPVNAVNNQIAKPRTKIVNNIVITKA